MEIFTVFIYISRWRQWRTVTGKQNKQFIVDSTLLKNEIRDDIDNQRRRRWRRKYFCCRITCGAEAITFVHYLCDDYGHFDYMAACRKTHQNWNSKFISSTNDYFAHNNCSLCVCVTTHFLLPFMRHELSIVRNNLWLNYCNTHTTATALHKQLPFTQIEAKMKLNDTKWYHLIAIVVTMSRRTTRRSSWRFALLTPKRD